MFNKYIDSHLHLQDKCFAGHVAKIIEKAEKAGVTRLFCNATRADEWPTVLRLAKQNRAVFPFLGIHPWFVSALSASWKTELESMLVNSRAGIGEIGLDKTRADFSRQARVFREQLQLAARLRRPVAVHCVRAWGRLLEILADFTPFNFQIMIHGFGGSREIMRELVKMGTFISFSPMLAHPDREKLRQVFIQTPLSHILLETDTPYQFCSDLAANNGLPPEFIEKKINHPLAVIKLYEYAARLRGMDKADLTGVLWKNGTIFTN